MVKADYYKYPIGSQAYCFLLNYIYIQNKLPEYEQPPMLSFNYVGFLALPRVETFGEVYCVRKPVYLPEFNIMWVDI